MLTRRNFLAAAATAASLFVAGCSGEKDEAPAEAAAPATNVLVAYFSATGNTEGVATAIAERLGADVFAIEAAEPYTEADLNYSDDASRTSVERANGTNPELAQVTPDGWADYDTVLLGYPIWWGEAAWPLRTFVEGSGTVLSSSRSARAPVIGARANASRRTPVTTRRRGLPTWGCNVARKRFICNIKREERR